MNNNLSNLNQSFFKRPMSRLGALVYVANYEHFNGGEGHETIY